MIDTTKILPGQEFKNMQELSVALTGKKMPSGNRYIVRVNEMKKYFSWEKIPGTNRIIITDVFKEPKTMYIPRGKYNSQLLSNMRNLELNKKYNNYDLYEILGLTSEYFTKPKYYLKCVNKTKLTLSTYDYFYKKINASLVQMLYSNLDVFSKKGCISYYRDYIYEFKPGSPIVEIPREYMEDIIHEALQHFSYDNEWLALHSSNAQLYKKYILDKLSDFHVKRYQRCYVFTNIKVFSDLPEPSKKAMNKLVVDKLVTGSLKYSESNRNKIQSIIFSTVPLQEC